MAVQSTRETNNVTFVIDVAHPRKPKRGNTGDEEKLNTRGDKLLIPKAVKHVARGLTADLVGNSKS